MMNYSATIEYTNRREAIVTLFDRSGEWAGSQRITVRSDDRSALYALGYQYASVAATGKGGTLDRYRAEEPAAPPASSARCQSRIEIGVERRPGNALNLEIGAPADRCINKPPAHWGENSPGALRWLASGGSPLVLGACSANCPRRLAS